MSYELSRRSKELGSGRRGVAACCTCWPIATFWTRWTSSTRKHASIQNSASTKGRIWRGLSTRTSTSTKESTAPINGCGQNASRRCEIDAREPSSFAHFLRPLLAWLTPEHCHEASARQRQPLAYACCCQRR